MNKELPKIIIWMTCYNHENFVRDAVDSIIEQTYKNWELFVANDGSTDKSGEILASYSDSRIHYYDFKENTKLVGVTNFLLNVCKTIDADYIACLASDDMWHKRKLEKQVAFLQKNPDYEACFTWDKIIFSSQNKGTYEHNLLYSHKENKSKFEWMNYFFKYGNCLNACSMLMNKNIFYELGQMNQTFFQLADYRLWMKFVSKYSFYLLREELTYYRRHDSNISEPTMEVLIRTSNEQYQIFKEIMASMDKYTFQRSFYAEIPYMNINTEEELLAAKFILLVNNHTCESEQAAMDLYFTHCGNEQFISILENKYFFDAQSFLTLSGKCGLLTKLNSSYHNEQLLFSPAMVFINAIDKNILSLDNINLYRYNVLTDLWEFTRKYENGVQQFENIKQLILKLQAKRILVKSKKRVLFIMAQHSTLSFSRIVREYQEDAEYYVALVPMREEIPVNDNLQTNELTKDISFVSLYNSDKHCLYFPNELSLEIDSVYYIDCLDNNYECSSMVAGYSLSIEQNCILEESIYRSIKHTDEKVLAMMKNIHIYNKEE